jgi:hypothetical protein
VISTGGAGGFGSVAWLTPVGVITSIALGTVAGSTAQIGLVPPGWRTPKANS